MTTKKVYLLTFDRNLTYDYTKLHSGIKNDSLVHTWSHYMLSSYILISDYSASTLTNSIRKYFPNHRFLIVEMKQSNYSGWLPNDAWVWIKRYTEVA